MNILESKDICMIDKYTDELKHSIDQWVTQKLTDKMDKSKVEFVKNFMKANTGHILGVDMRKIVTSTVLTSCQWRLIRRCQDCAGDKDTTL